MYADSIVSCECGAGLTVPVSPCRSELSCGRLVDDVSREATDAKCLLTRCTSSCGVLTCSLEVRLAALIGCESVVLCSAALTSRWSSSTTTRTTAQHDRPTGPPVVTQRGSVACHRRPLDESVTVPAAYHNCTHQHPPLAFFVVATSSDKSLSRVPDTWLSQVAACDVMADCTVVCSAAGNTAEQHHG